MHNRSKMSSKTTKKKKLTSSLSLTSSSSSLTASSIHIDPFNYYSCTVTILYFIGCLPIFYKIYDTSKMIIDEEFHLKQGKLYCMGKYDEWDNKITTLPGLYIITTIILLPFKLCTTFTLRLISLIASTVNIFILWQIRVKFYLQNKSKKIKKIDGNSNNSSSSKGSNTGRNDNIQLLLNSLDVLSINLLPPLYFFSNLYYTDVVSITFILLLFYYWMNENYLISSIFGFCSILIRQTNIIWIFMVFAINIMDQLQYFVNDIQVKYQKKMNNLDNIKHIIPKLLKNKKLLKIYIKNLFDKCIGYLFVQIIFIIFILINGSIVIGDKTAHTVTIHLTQLLYFSLFVSFFQLNAIIMKIPKIFDIIKMHKSKICLILIIFSIIVRYNSLVHPYLLADNRHYTFYIWNRLYGKYEFFKYAIIPVYIFSLIFLYDNLKMKTITFQLTFYLCTIIVLMLQKLLEIRYFLIPFIIYRINLRSLKLHELIMELILYLLINAITLYVFFTKEIYWKNFDEAQRLIW